MAMVALVVFTTFQSFAVFAAIIQGAWLFVVLGLVFLGTGLLFDRARRGIAATLEGADAMNRTLTVGLVVAAQAVLVAVGVAPQLSARLTGDTYTFRVEAVDPIDPFRGAYVTLGYPDLRPDGSVGGGRARWTTGRAAPVYITLAERDGSASPRLPPRPTGLRALPGVRRHRLGGPVRHRELVPAPGRGRADAGRAPRGRGRRGADRLAGPTRPSWTSGAE